MVACAVEELESTLHVCNNCLCLLHKCPDDVRVMGCGVKELKVKLRALVVK
jgi:hypothetical protein